MLVHSARARSFDVSTFARRDPPPPPPVKAWQSTRSSTEAAPPQVTELLATAHGGSPVEQGRALGALDGLTGNARITDVALRSGTDTAFLSYAPANDRGVEAATSARPDEPAPSSPDYPADQLYAASGKPAAYDVRQSNLGDCYFVATLAAAARQRPESIQNAISYDAETQSYNVTLYKDGAAQTINVTQADIADNIVRGGGSRIDDGDRDAALWPAVMETAYAKMHDSNHADGLEEGYNAIANGGWASDANKALFNDEGQKLTFSAWPWDNKTEKLNALATEVSTALANGQPVTLSTNAESLIETITGHKMGDQDGLADNHVYSVDSIYQDEKGDWQVELRNPWSHNSGVGEDQDSYQAHITVPLSSLVDTGGFDSFQVAN